ncbi:transglutaminase-like domain-containing protein [Bergeyella sp. RCAD1439]|uniref:transglutaminase-like domain-containing protein n=1 Tax=Bergeyella anatis TaxID=3113737 RepID=UPI002E16C35F|nr:transglutaminase-like domain-containing protein [Bergeyella sp. RCAD1439]
MKQLFFIGFYCVILSLTSCQPTARLLKYIPSQKIERLTFEESSNKDFPFHCNESENDYIKQLNDNYGLQNMVKGKTEIEAVGILTNWTNKQWPHSGNNVPSKSDAISILREAKQGKKFRCVEYGIVNASVLNAVGLKARTIGLKTKDVEKVKYAGGHVASEVYLSSYKKWIFADAQFNVIPFLNDIPLNAVELQKAIIGNKQELQFKRNGIIIDSKEKSDYLKFISKYLFYFDINFDNRIGVADKEKHNGFYKLMLVPIGKEKPKTFQRDSKIEAIYTNSINTFYTIPN